MKKVKLVILLGVIALIFYYWNSEQSKPKNSKSLNNEPWLLVNSKSAKSLPPLKKAIYEVWKAQSFLTNQQVEVLKDLIDRKKEYSLEELLKIYEEHKPQVSSETNEPESSSKKPEITPSEVPKSEATSQIPTSEPPIKTSLKSDETYRLAFLALLNQLQASNNSEMLIKAISLLEISNQSRSDYLQALWSLKGLRELDLLNQPLWKEWVNLPIAPSKLNALLPNWFSSDTSWLTDDNLEFILRNWELVWEALTKQNQSQRKFKLRTDIANIYNCFWKASTGQEWDLVEFCQELEVDKAQYTLFPLRVNGNHWGLFILAEIIKEPTPPMLGSMWLESDSSVETKIYYTSSGGGDLVEEKKQLEPFIFQILGERVKIEIIQPKDRNSKGYECGVYLCFYIREILERGELKLEREYSEKECQEFRREWKGRIGAEKWGKWD